MNVPSQLVLQYWTYSTQGKIWEKNTDQYLHGNYMELSHQICPIKPLHRASHLKQASEPLEQYWFPKFKKQFRSRGNNMERKVLPKKKIQQPICCSGPLALQGPIAPPLYSFGQKQRIGSMENVAAVLATDWYEMIWTYMNYTISLLSST